MDSKLTNWLKDVLGRRLISVLALVYTYDGEKEFENPQELDLQFLSCGHGKLVCSYDGSSIEWQDNYIHEVDMEEFGQQLLENVSNRSIWNSVVNKMLLDAELINSIVEDSVIGVRFSFENRETISVLNLGDELYVYRDIPEEVIIDQGVVFSSVV